MGLNPFPLGDYISLKKTDDHKIYLDQSTPPPTLTPVKQMDLPVPANLVGWES